MDALGARLKPQGPYTSPGRRWALGLLGGVLVGFGARLADG